MMFCAICTDEIGPFVSRPLGKGGALVRVCTDCDGVHPRSGRYTFSEGGASRGACNHANDGNRRIAPKGSVRK